MEPVRLDTKAAPAYRAPALIHRLLGNSSLSQQRTHGDDEDDEDDEGDEVDFESDGEVAPNFSPVMSNATCHKTRKGFKLFPIDHRFPQGRYSLAAVQEVCDNREAFLRDMPGWKIANLADGYAQGKSYGGRTGMQKRNDVGHQLASYTVY